MITKKQYKAFAKFVADEIFKNTVEENPRCFCEVACAELRELGMVEYHNGQWLYGGLSGTDTTDPRDIHERVNITR